MERLFGITDDKNAYFYTLEVKNLDRIISELEAIFSFEKKDVVLCDFYNYEVHNYGKYQSDISNGYASVIDTNVMHIDKKNFGLSVENFINPCFGVIELVIKYPSQISRVINRTFKNDYGKMIDFTDMMKIVNSIDNVPNTFDYDSVVDKRLKYMNTSFSSNVNEMTNINKQLYLNEKEKQISLDKYYNIIMILAENINFKLVDTYSLSEKYDEEIENMKRFAIRNSKLFEMPIFNSIIKKLQVPVNVDDFIVHSKNVKKYEYSDKYNVYLQKDRNCDIM